MIGAASSGIAPCQVLCARSIPYDCFEKGSEVGGSDHTGFSEALRSEAGHPPGHMLGDCAIHLPDRGALFVGDLLCSWNPLTGSRGPQLMPGAFGASSQESLDSPARLEHLDGVLIIGRGEPWTEGVGAAVAQARAQGPT